MVYNRKSRHYGGENPEWPAEVEAAVAVMPSLFDRPHHYITRFRLLRTAPLPTAGYIGPIESPELRWRECAVCNKRECAMADENEKEAS